MEDEDGSTAAAVDDTSSVSNETHTIDATDKPIEDEVENSEATALEPNNTLQAEENPDSPPELQQPEAASGEPSPAEQSTIPDLIDEADQEEPQQTDEAGLAEKDDSENADCSEQLVEEPTESNPASEDIVSNDNEASAVQEAKAESPVVDDNADREEPEENMDDAADSPPADDSPDIEQENEKQQRSPPSEEDVSDEPFAKK